MTPTEIAQVVNITLEKLGLLKPYVSQAKAFRMYGRTNVERWVKEGWVKPVRDTETSSKRYNIWELEKVAFNNNVLNKFKNENHKRTNRKVKQG